MFATIAEIHDLATARVLIAALKAYGFHPLEAGKNGVPGMPGVYNRRGVGIVVPEDEAEDARILAEDLLRDMRQAEPGS